MKYLLFNILLFVLTTAWSQGVYNDPNTWSETKSQSDTTQGEDQQDYYAEKPFYFGFGLGMDFGGIGTKLEFMFLDFAGAFAGIGYKLDGLGVNGGMMFKIPHQMATPYFLAMYGYNGVILIQGAEHLNKTSHGISIGGGLELKTKNLNVWQLGVILPFRSQNFMDHYEDLEDNPNVDINNMPKVGFSLGFKIMIN